MGGIAESHSAAGALIAIPATTVDTLHYGLAITAPFA